VVHLGNLALSGTTPAVSSYADVKGFNKVTLVVVSNTITDAGTASGYTVTFQDSADTTAAAAASVVAADAVNDTLTLTEVTDGDDNTVLGSFGYLGTDRYVGVSAVGTTGTDADLSVYAILEDPHTAPPTLIGTAVART
jgi:hypothetical protein